MSLDKAFILENLPSNCVYAAYRGSIAHGLYVPSTDPNSIDDVDVMAVYVDDVSSYLGLKAGRKSSNYFVESLDVESHELTKYLNLCLKSNPNVFSSLWVNPAHVLYVDPLFEELFLFNRTLFSSKRMYATYSGYAYSQLAEMQRKDKTYQGYMGSKRKAIVDTYGYDVKNAAHLIRLLTMCVEFLRTGELIVERTDDAHIYLGIKHGLWTLDEVIKRATELRAEAETAVRESTLPAEPETYEVDNMCCDFLLSKIIGGHSRSE